MKRTMLLGAVTLGLLVAAPPVSLGAPNKAAVKKAKKSEKARKATRAKKARKGKKAVALRSGKKKKGPTFTFGPMDVTAGPEKPQAGYLIPRARVKYTRPSHEKELLTWIIRSMRSR